MLIDVTNSPKLSRIDHFFFLIAEGAGSETRGLSPELERRLDTIRKQSRFAGKADESITLLEDSPSKITLLGLGKREELSPRSLKTALHGLAKVARRGKDQKIALSFPYILPELDGDETLRLLVDLTAHADYKYDVYRTADPEGKREPIHCTIVPPGELSRKRASSIREAGLALAGSVRTVRDLGNGPPNEITPQRLAERAREVARSVGVKCTIYDKKQIEKMKMGGLLAVNRGSAEEPRLVVLDYKPRGAKKTVCVVGKGITFDSGGISIKPAEKMEEMKFDMCGAAAVIGIIEAAAKLELRHRVVAIFPATENLPSGSAYKPGDIITMMSGKTVEVVNTDAEGRIILGDALHFSSTFKPDHLIDFATLTGACVVALGSEASGLFTSDDELAQKLIEAGEKVGERLWRLPEWTEYKDLIRSEWADMKNSGGRMAGASTAAVFLKEFVDCPSWAHLDIAGTAWAEGETPRDPKGATGVGVRMAIAFLESLD